ncbi:MAG: transporter substrate-binding domain-containing protein, partial [Desulfotignum sp.]|nr:transporter substrate-binding domain-containing protein [Desulfotignum sp.]
SAEANYPPQSYINEDGKLEGFDISVGKEVAKRLGVKARHVTVDWNLITAGKWSKRWDISIGSMTPTKERKKVLFFTMPYYSAPAQFAIHKNNKTINKVSDLAEKKIGVTTESTYERYLEKDLIIENTDIKYQDWKPGKIRTYLADAEYIQDLSLGDGVRLDAILSSRQTLAEAISEGCGGSGCPLKMLGDPVYYEPLSFALDNTRPDSDTLLKKLNEIIQSMYDDGTLVELSMKFFNTNLIPK